VAFDSAAQGAEWVLTRWFGFRAEQLTWLFGALGEDDYEGVGPGSRDGLAASSTHIQNRLSP
jgi:hypothetical protein